jgi:hypothetical protein
MIFQIKVQYSFADNLSKALFAACFMLVSCLTYSSTLNMGAIYTSETLL